MCLMKFYRKVLTPGMIDKIVKSYGQEVHHDNRNMRG